MAPVHTFIQEQEENPRLLLCALAHIPSERKREVGGALSYIYNGGVQAALVAGIEEKRRGGGGGERRNQPTTLTRTQIRDTHCHPSPTIHQETQPRKAGGEGRFAREIHYVGDPPDLHIIKVLHNTHSNVNGIPEMLFSSSVIECTLKAQTTERLSILQAVNGRESHLMSQACSWRDARSLFSAETPVVL